MDAEMDWKTLLGAVLAEFDCQTGTLHRAEGGGRVLELVSQIGVPDSLMEKITAIPFGKGIAGAAAEREEPVELCNLQEDLGGVARIGARRTGVSGSLAVPVFSPVTGEVIGTLGIGKYQPHDFTEEEKERLAGHARRVARLFAENHS